MNFSRLSPEEARQSQQAMADAFLHGEADYPDESIDTAVAANRLNVWYSANPPQENI